MTYAELLFSSRRPDLQQVRAASLDPLGRCIAGGIAGLWSARLQRIEHFLATLGALGEDHGAEGEFFGGVLVPRSDPFAVGDAEPWRQI
jgi:hypothetical protein